MTPQDQQVALWQGFVARVTLTFPFEVELIVRPCRDDNVRAEMAVALHVLERDSREPITVSTRRPCAPWTDDRAAEEMVFDLLEIALRHEIHESVRIDGKLAREMHRPVAEG